MENYENLFENLPPEINFWIESYFDQECRLRARLMCKKWFYIFKHTHFDIYLPSKDSQFEDMIDTLSRCRQPFSLSLHKSDKLGPTAIRIDMLSKMTNLTALKLSMLNKKDRGYVLQLTDKIQRIEGQITVSSSNTTIATSLTYLDVISVALNSPLPNLEHLATTNSDYAKVLPHLGESTKLTSLTVGRLRLNLNSRQFLNRLTQLKVLKLESCFYNNSNLQLSLPNLEVLECLIVGRIDCASTKLTAMRVMADDFQLNVNPHPTLKSLTLVNSHTKNIVDKDLNALEALPALEELNLSVQHPTGPTGKFLQFINHETLTKLSTGLTCPNLDEISRFVNLHELNLILQLPNTTLDGVSRLSNLTKLALAGDKLPYMEWLNQLTLLQELYLDFKSSESCDIPLDLANLVNLRTLIIPVKSNKIISSLNKLKELQRLEFPRTNENILPDMIQLTSLAFYQAPDNDQIAKLTRLRELDCIIVTNHEIMELTNLRKLTKFICRSVTADYHYLTLLTSLQSMAFSNNMSLGNWSGATVWSYYNAYPDIVRKLPNFVYGPKDSQTLTYCFAFPERNNSTWNG